MEEKETVLIEINAKLDRIEENQKRAKKRNSIIMCSFLAFLIFLAIIITLTAIPIIRDYNYLMQEVRKAGEIIDSIDTEELKRITDSVSSIDFEQLSATISKLEEIDMDGLIKAINQIQSSINSFYSFIN